MGISVPGETQDACPGDFGLRYVRPGLAHAVVVLGGSNRPFFLRCWQTWRSPEVLKGGFGTPR